MRRHAPWLIALVAACGSDNCHRPTPLPVSSCISPRSSMPAPAGCSNDGAEPNDDLPMATAPASGSACGTTARSGVLAGDGDVDVFRSGDCDLEEVDPSAVLESSDSLRLCQFLACSHGTTNVFGCYQDAPGDGLVDGGTPRVWKARSESGFIGCCRNGNGRVSAQVECGGLRLQSVESFVWIDGGDQPLPGRKCPSYSVNWRVH